MDDGTFLNIQLFTIGWFICFHFLELSRKKWSLESFTDCFYDKVNKATIWYESLIDPISGGAPNMGGNDGTHIYLTSMISYHDFRPTLSLVSSAFHIPINPVFNKNISYNQFLV